MAKYKQLSVILKDRQGRYWMLSASALQPVLEEAKPVYMTLKNSSGEGGLQQQNQVKKPTPSNRTIYALPLQRSQERSGLVS